VPDKGMLYGLQAAFCLAIQQQQSRLFAPSQLLLTEVLCFVAANGSRRN